jgi:hypothetical protein
MEITVGSVVTVGGGKVEYEVIAVEPDGTPRLRSAKVSSWHLSEAETAKVNVKTTPQLTPKQVPFDAHVWLDDHCSCGWEPKPGAKYPKKSWVSHRGAAASKAAKAAK